MTPPRFSNECVDQLIQRTVAGDRAAREDLFAYIRQFVLGMKLRQLGPYSRDPDYRADVCARVVTRFLVNDHERLRRYLERPERSFAALLAVVAVRVTIDLARTLRQNIAARHEPQFRWVKEVSLIDEDEPTPPSSDAAIRLLDVRRYLETYPDRVAVELLQHSIESHESWSDIAGRYCLSPNAARQRVRRLRASLQRWLDATATNSGCEHAQQRSARDRRGQRGSRPGEIGLHLNKKLV